MAIDKNMEITNTIILAAKSYSLPVVTTVESTATSCLNIAPLFAPDGNLDPFLVPFQDPLQASAVIHEKLSCGYRFSVKNVSYVYSRYQERLRDAKTRLLDCLRRGVFDPGSRETIIREAGVALHLLLGGSPDANDPSGQIDKMLIDLGLQSDNQRLFDKHKDINKFFNATKHGKKPENRKDAALILSNHGVLLTIDYFETVVRVFRWYFQRHSSAKRVPDWQELEKIRYSDYKIGYSFRYARRWTRGM